MYTFACREERTRGLNVFAGLAPTHGYPAGTELCSQGSLPEDVYLLDEGLVLLSCLEDDGGELIVGFRSAGWVSGAACVILRQPLPVNITTASRCKMRRVSAEAFIQVLQRDASAAWYLYEMLSREVYDHVASLSGLALLSARQRLEQILWDLTAFGGNSGFVAGRTPPSVMDLTRWSQDQSLDFRRSTEGSVGAETCRPHPKNKGSGRPTRLPERPPIKTRKGAFGDVAGTATRLQLPLKQSQMARLLGITPQYLSMLFRQLEHDGLLKRSRGWLLIPDRARLWHRQSSTSFSQHQS